MSEFMTLDQFEKLDTAREYLTKAPVGSQEFDAAAEHLRWVLDNHQEYRVHVAVIVEGVIKLRNGEKRVIHRLKEILT